MPFTFTTRVLPADVLRNLNEIPGVRVTNGSWGQRILTPTNGAFIVQGILDSASVKYAASGQPEPGALNALPPLPDLRPWVPAFLTPYQRAGVLFGALRPGTHFWWSPGAGKTLGAIVWACLGPRAHKTVFVTRAAARKTIANEVQKYTTLKPQILMGMEPTPIDGDTNIVVVGWETLPAHVQTLIKWGPHSVIYDEAHKGKSHKRFEAIPQEDGGVVFKRKENIASAAEQLSKAAKRRLATTATPIKDRLRDLWTQLDLIEPWAFGKYYDFTKRYCDARENPWGGLDTSGRSNVDELMKRLSFSVHQVSYSTTHGQLPPKRRQVHYIDPADQVRSVGFAKEMKEAEKRGGTSLLECRLAEACARKRKSVVELVEQNIGTGGKIVVFTGRRRDCEELHAAIRKALDEKIPVWMGHGGTSTTIRDGIREAYMAQQGPCVLVGTGDAWGESVNLQDTDLAIISMLPYTPGQVIQWEGRFSRQGQKRPVLIQYLIAEGTVDEHVAHLLLDKLPAVEKVAADEQVAGFGKELSGLADEKAIIAGLMAKLANTGEDDGD